MRKSEEIQIQIARLQVEYETARADELAGSVREIRSLMDEHGVTLSDLAGRRKRTAGKKGAVPPKFKDPATGNTWTGRGRAPKWITQAEEEGKNREDFRIVA